MRHNIGYSSAEESIMKKFLLNQFVKERSLLIVTFVYLTGLTINIFFLKCFLHFTILITDIPNSKIMPAGLYF